jgi:uncharacterized protein
MAGDFGNLTRGVFPSILKDTHASPATQPFWDAAKQDRLVAPRCTSCGTFRLPPSPFCFQCRSRDVEWVELPGTGTIYTFTVVRHPLHPDLADACPYVSGVVELDGTQGAGARMLVNIIDVDPDTVRIGDRVEIVWEHVNAEMTTPRFRPVRT